MQKIKSFQDYKDWFAEWYKTAEQNYSDYYWHKFPEEIPKVKKVVAFLVGDKLWVGVFDKIEDFENNRVKFWRYIEFTEEIKKHLDDLKRV